MPNKREQVILQCQAVAGLASAVADLYSTEVVILQDGVHGYGLIDQVGKRTASFMEQLGDMLNATDAVDAEDDWMIPVFKEAQRLWPRDISKFSPQD